MWNGIFDTLRPYINSILIGAGGFLLAYILSQITNRLLVKIIGIEWSKFLGSLAGTAVIIWTIKIILESAGAIGFVVVLVTAITGAFALGSERVAGDMVAGISLFFSHVFKHGDHVSIAGYEGVVLHTSLWMTILESKFGEYIYIRNSDVTGGTIINYSIQPGRLISIKLYLSIEEDLSAAISEIKKAIADFSPKIKNLREMYHPRVFISESEVEHVKIEVQAYTDQMTDQEDEQTRLYLLASSAIKNMGLKLS